MKHASILAAMFVATTMIACSKAPPPPPADGAEAGGPAAQGAAPASTPVPAGGRLEVSPQSFSLCEHPDGLIEADVTWDATAAGSRWVQIFVESPTTARKLWASKPAEGEGRTGRWVRDGSQFTLVDSETSATLATASVTAVACGS